jgi:hypothetical protein
MSEAIELPRPSLNERIKERLNKKKIWESQPISAEAVKRLSVIQSKVSNEDFKQALEERIQKLPDQLQYKDSSALKDQIKQEVGQGIIPTIIYGPSYFIYRFFAGPAKNSEVDLVSKSAKEWQLYLTKTKEGKKFVSGYKSSRDTERLNYIVKNIIDGKPPVMPKHTKFFARLGIAT